MAIEFVTELQALRKPVQTELLAHARLLAQFGPRLGRPRVDTLKGSRYPNMKELRFGADGGVWRVAFAFDPQREAALLPWVTRRGFRKPASTANRSVAPTADSQITLTE